MGPQKIAKEFPAFNIDLLFEEMSGMHDQALAGLARFNSQLAQKTFLSKIHGDFPVVIGGDHSCAIGTWSGVSAFYGRKMGLLWIDAHMDAHTFSTSETGNIHGMPLAALLGHGNPSLTQVMSMNPKVDPVKTVLFGIRSFESGEERLIKNIGVRVFKMDEIFERGFWTCWSEAIQIVSQNNQPYGVSIDLDGLDPEEIPGVGTPVAGGLKKSVVLKAVTSLLKDPSLSALEIVEYNPQFDVDFVSGQFVVEICRRVASLRGPQEMDALFNEMKNAP